MLLPLVRASGQVVQADPKMVRQGAEIVNAWHILTAFKFLIVPFPNANGGPDLRLCLARLFPKLPKS